MHLTQLRAPLQRVVTRGYQASVVLPWACLPERFAGLRLDGANAKVEGRRFAAVKSQGAYKIPNKKTKPKKLGAKKTGDQYVIPGNIIYKQRGTVWHPGENTIIGRDHTIHSAIAGYVKYYRDPKRHPKRQYIGVVYDRNDTLPYPPGNPRKRRLGLVAVPRAEPAPEPDLITASGIPRYVVRDDPPEPEAAAKPQSKTGDYKKRTIQMNPELIREMEEIKAKQGTRILRLQKDYSYRESNWEIGRLVGPAGRVQGTEKLVSRKAKLRQWRRRRVGFFNLQKGIAQEKKARRAAHQAEEKRRKEIKAREREQLLAEEQAKRVAQAAADAAALKQTPTEP